MTGDNNHKHDDLLGCFTFLKIQGYSVVVVVVEVVVVEVVVVVVVVLLAPMPTRLFGDQHFDPLFDQHFFEDFIPLRSVS